MAFLHEKRLGKDQMPSMDIAFKLKSLKLLVLEIDGVLTDGLTWQDYQGEWRRYFSVRDAIGLRALQKAGVAIAVITSGSAHGLLDQGEMTYVGIDNVIERCDDKDQAIRAMMSQMGLAAEQVALMSASEFDVAIWRWLGCGLTVADAAPSVRSAATLVTTRPGGDGAVLEICNAILHYQGAPRSSRHGRFANA